MNEQLSFNATIEIDQAQSMKNIKKVVDDIGKSTAIEIKGFNIDPNTLSKQLQSAMKQTFNFNKDTGLNSLTSVIKGAYGEILTVQQSVDEHGKTIIENAKLTTDTLKAQKARYEEIRALYEKLGKLQLDNMTASEKKKKDIADEVKETQKLIRQKEKALKADENMINASLQENVIDKQKLKNSIAIAKEEDKITKRKESAYAKLQKAWELIHKYEMQSVGANEKDLEVLNRKKAVAEQLRAKIQGTINVTGLGDKKLKEDIDALKEIQALELKVAKHAHEEKTLAAKYAQEEKTLNTELIALDNKRLATKKQLEMATAGTKEYAVLEKQLEQQALAVLQKKAQIDEKGVTNQKVLNTLAQKELELQNQLEVSKAKQEDAREKEEEAVKRLIATTQKSMGIDINNTLSRKADFITNSDEKAIERIQAKLKDLNGTSLRDVKNQIADLKLEWKEVNSSISNTQFKQATSLVDELGNGFKRLTNYIMGTLVINKLWDTFHEGVEYLKELDDAYTDVAISMDISRKEFDEWTKDARKIAQANGVMTTSIMDMVKIYATSGETISQIQDKLEGTAMIQNITQWDAEKTTSVVNSIIGQYKLMEKEINGVTGNMSNAIQYMGDALVGVSNALTVDNVAGIQEIASAIDEAGGIMEQAGASMEWYMGVTGTLNETMNATGSEIGNAFKMISARVFAQAQAMEELGESSENIEVEMRKAEKALASVGVSIRDASDPSQLRGLEEIMNELAGQWDNLSDATKNFVAEGVAGTNRRNYFISMMENYDRVLTLTNAGLESQGALAEANEVRVQSLAGQINILKDRLMSLMDGFTPVIYGAVQLASSILGIVNAVGAIPSAMGIATASFLSFNKTGQLVRDSLLQLGDSYNPIIKNVNTLIKTWDIKKTKLTDLIKETQLEINVTKQNIIEKEKLGKSTHWLNTKLDLQQKQLKGAQLQLALTTVKTVALQAAMSMGLSVAITLVTSALSKAVDWLKDYSDHATRAKEATEDVANLSGDIQNRLNGNVGETISQLDKLIKKYNDINTSQEEKAELSSEINSLKQELIGYDDEYARILNNENLSYQEQLGLLKQINKEKALENAEELDKKMDKQEKVSGTKEWHADQLNKNNSNIKELQDAIASAQDGMGYFKGKKMSVNELQETLDGQKEAFKEHYLFLLDWNNNVQTMLDAGWDTDKTKADIEGLSDAFEQIAVETEEGYVPIENAEKAVNESIERLGDSANYLVDRATIANEALTGLEKTLENIGDASSEDAFNSIVEYVELIDEGSEEAKSALSSLKRAFPEMGAEIDTLSEAVDYLGSKAMIEVAESAENLHSILNDIKKDGEKALDPSTMKELLELYPELGSKVGDVAYVQEFLNEKIEEMGEATQNMYNDMLAQDSEFWNSKMKNSEQWLNHEQEVQQRATELGAEMLGIQAEDFASYINEKGGFREIDYTNAANAAEAEGMLNGNLLTQMLQWYSSYVNEKGGARDVDMTNIVEFLNSQGVAEAQTIDQLVEMWNSYYKAKKAEIQSSLSTLSNAISAGNPYDDMGNLTPAQSKQLANLNKQMAALENASKNMGNYFNTVDKTFNQITSSVAGSKGFGDRIGDALSGATSKPSSSSSSSKDTEQVVEDLELVIDRYYELNDALDDVNNKLELNRQLQANAKDMNTVKKLHKEEINLLNEKVKAMEKLQLEQRNDMLDQKNKLSSAGFKFDKEGNITNYSSQLKAMEKYANSLSGEAKEAQIAYVNSIVDVINAYTTLTNDSLPSTELALESLQEEIEKVNKEHEKTIQLIETLGDRYYEINGQITDVDNKLALVRAKQENATPSERVKLMEEEIALMKERQRLIAQQKSELETEANEIAKKLGEKGVEFNADGTIKNYKQLMENLTTVANQYVGDTRDEMVEDAETLLDLIEQYDDIIRNTLPDLAVEWEEYTSSIREAEKAMAEQVTEVQKNVTSAIENELQKRTEAVKSELQKQKDAYNKQFDEEDWEDSLSEEQRKLDEIQQAINNMSRDTSLAGQLKLQQLREEYEAQQKVIDDMIRDKEKENGNNRFDEEMEKLDQELEEALDPQNIADLVNQALVDGFVTIGDEVVALDSLMSDWLNETGDGLYAIGDTLREELIDNLRVAQELMAGMGMIGGTGSGATIDQNTALKDIENSINANFNSGGSPLKENPQKMEIAIGSLLEVKGNVTEDVLPKLESMIQTAKSELIEEITYEMMRR